MRLYCLISVDCLIYALTVLYVTFMPRAMRQLDQSTSATSRDVSIDCIVSA